MNAVQRSRCLSWGPIGVYRLGFGTGTSLHCESSIWSLCLFWFLGFCDPNIFFGFIFVHVVTQPRACMLWLIPITCDGGCHGTLGGWLSALGLWGKPHRMIGAEGKVYVLGSRTINPSRVFRQRFLKTNTCFIKYFSFPSVYHRSHPNATSGPDKLLLAQSPRPDEHASASRQQMGSQAGSFGGWLQSARHVSTCASKNWKSVREREGPRFQHIYLGAYNPTYFKNMRSFPIGSKKLSSDLTVGINRMDCLLSWWPLVGDKRRNQSKIIQFLTSRIYENNGNTNERSLDTRVCDVCSPALTVFTSRQLRSHLGNMNRLDLEERDVCITQTESMWLTLYDPVISCMVSMFSILQLCSGPCHEIFETFCGWALLSA